MYGWLHKLISRHVFVLQTFLQNLTNIYHTISVKLVLSTKNKKITYNIT